jgi:flagellar motor component MotA
MLSRFLTGLVIALGLILAVIIFSSSLHGILIFLHWPSAVIIILIPMTVLLMNFSLKEIKKAFTCVFFNIHQQATEPALQRSKLIFAAWQKYVFLAGGCGVLMGLILMLAYIADKAKIGMGLSTTLICLLYSLVLNLVIIIPCLTAIRKRLIKNT